MILRPALAALTAALLAGATGAAAQTSAASMPSAASTLPAGAVDDALALAADGARTLAPSGARVHVVAGTLDPRLRLAPCAHATPFLPAGSPAWGRTRIGLRCSAGAAWTVYLPVTVQVLAPAVVVASPLPAGARLDVSQLALAEVDWAAAAMPPHARADALAGRVLARALAAGQPLREIDLQPRVWFAAGDLVRISARGPGFAIQTEGHALTPGHAGRPARVRTESGRIVTGRPAGERLLEALP